MIPRSAPFDSIRETSRGIIQQLYKHMPRKLYHYTSGEGLLGILRSGHLRGSNYAFMNDRSEFTYGADLLREIVAERARSPRDDVDQDYYHAILTSEAPVVSDLYLACFCTKGDLLSQWRGYGSGGSRYCLEFSPTDFKTLNNASPLLPVIYSRARQRSLLNDLLHAHLAGLYDHCDRGRELYVPAALCTFECSLTALALFKAESFREEHEWRSILLVCPGEYEEQLEFASSAGLMKPSLPLLAASRNGKLPIREVTCGASTSSGQAMRAARLMLARYGYNRVPVNPSQIPLSG